jgi:hypothetical protein
LGGGAYRPRSAWQREGPMSMKRIVLASVFLGGGCVAPLMAACSSSSGTGGSPSGAGGAAGTGGASMVCDGTCATLTDKCGVATTSSCAADCLANSSTYHDCLSAAGSDCNEIALCALEEGCPNGGGMPDGSATCAETASCQGVCNANSLGSSCLCTCLSKLDPTLAIYLFINASCAVAECPSCDSAVPGPACNQCYDMNCGAAHATCYAH